MAVKLLSSSGGSVTLDVGVTASNFALTVPSANGTVITTGSTGQVIPKAALPTGSVLQVVSITSTTRQSISSASFVDITEMSLSITPTSATSKILVLVMISASGGNNNSLINLYRGASTILTGAGATYNSAVGTGTATNNQTVTQPIIYLDSPATTSSVNYNLKGTSIGTSGPLIINQRANDTNVVSAASTITLMEIAA